uniref:C2H2-type domain-containing protein n=1 Tax=Periophthalmus magnuspinnatus TaxID=409849 RepID=A0A3B4B6I9_9GOBI
MASGYPPPFEGTGEVKEGFLCPLCLKDLQSFYQLQDHYEEEHSGDDRHFILFVANNIISVF